MLECSRCEWNDSVAGTQKVLGKCSTLEVINYSGRSSHEQPLLIFTNASKWSGAFLSENEADDLIKPLLYFG